MANAIGMGRVALPAPFKIPGFTGFWLSASSGSFARVVTQLALSWVTLEATGSPFLVGVVMAARSVPQLVMGIPAGALADGLDRRRIILGTNAATTLLLLVLVGLTTGGALPTAALIGVSLVFGMLDTVRMAATQAYAFDLVRASRATSGMALTNFGTQLLSMVGGLVGGYMLQQFGSSTTFGVTALAVLIAIVVLVQARPAAAEL